MFFTASEGNASVRAVRREFGRDEVISFAMAGLIK
jgi:hypothetical protein